MQRRITSKKNRFIKLVVQITAIQGNAQYFRNNVIDRFTIPIQPCVLTLAYTYREELRTTPEKIDAMMESKQVLGAAKLLVASLKQVKSDDMMQIGALNDIRRTLTTQKNVSAKESTKSEISSSINNFLTCRRYTICWSKSCIIIYI